MLHFLIILIFFIIFIIWEFFSPFWIYEPKIVSKQNTLRISSSLRKQLK